MLFTWARESAKDVCNKATKAFLEDGWGRRRMNGERNPQPVEIIA